MTVENKFEAVRSYAKRLRQRDLNFTSEHMDPAANAYVAWLDLMGAGHMMNTSINKTANALARLHMAVEKARDSTAFSGRILPINDGVFIVGRSKREIMSMAGRVMITLSANFIAVPRPHDRFLLRGGIAYGPVYFGEALNSGLNPKKLRESASFLNTLLFGPGLIQAYRSESSAPPYGIALAESARSFSPADEEPFRMTHWMWWNPNEVLDYPKNVPPLTTLKDCLCADLKSHFKWMSDSLIYHGVSHDKIKAWNDQCEQYFRFS